MVGQVELHHHEVIGDQQDGAARGEGDADDHDVEQQLFQRETAAFEAVGREIAQDEAGQNGEQRIDNTVSGSLQEALGEDLLIVVPRDGEVKDLGRIGRNVLRSLQGGDDAPEDGKRRQESEYHEHEHVDRLPGCGFCGFIHGCVRSLPVKFYNCSL